MKNIGFIGCGKMAGAIINGILDAGLFSKDNIKASEYNFENATINSQKLGINVFCDNKKLAKESDIIFIATKPNQVEGVLEEISEIVNEQKLIVSIAAGVKLQKIETYLKDTPVIRVMPNAPLMVQEGMSAMVKGHFASNNDVKIVKEIFENLGKCITVSEDKIDIVTAISGSGPAFFYKIIHEIALAGEQLGMDYNNSLLLAEQTALGSAKLMLQSDLTPVELIKNISTKGGCTEVGVSVMNNKDTASLFNEIIANTTIKAKNLG